MLDEQILKGARGGGTVLDNQSIPNALAIDDARGNTVCPQLADDRDLLARSINDRSGTSAGDVGSGRQRDDITVSGIVHGLLEAAGNLGIGPFGSQQGKNASKWNTYHKRHNISPKK